MKTRKLLYLLVIPLIIFACAAHLAQAQALPAAAPLADDPTPPASPVKLIFIHHSTGGNWLADPNNDQPYGGLAQALMQNNYFVSATNYGWGPEAIGDRTDIPNWPEWFTGPNRDTILAAVYGESGQNYGDFGAWSRLPNDPGGENEIMMLKSCFPNSDLYGDPNDPPASSPNDEFSVSNAKAVYNDLLTYFETRQDKLFIVITAPPLQSSETAPDRAANARAFNNWLVNDWLAAYAHNNVAVFDYYNVLTDKSNANAESGNHHRWWNGAVQHVQAVNSNYSAYPSGDSHPSTAGHQKAAAEFVPLLNVFYNRWKAGAPAPRPTPPPATKPAPEATPELVIAPQPAADVIDDFESEVERYVDVDKSTIDLTQDTTNAHSGSASLRVNYNVAAGGWGSFGRGFDSPQDLSSGTGLALWVRSEKGGQPIAIILYSGDLDSAAPFETHLTLPGPDQGWQQFVLPWAEFAKPDWAGAEGLAQIDPQRITSYGFSILDADGNQNTGTLWIDDLALAMGATQPPPQPPPTSASPEQPQPTAEPIAGETPPAPAPGKSTGPCPAFALALALGGSALWLARKH